METQQGNKWRFIAILSFVIFGIVIAGGILFWAGRFAPSLRDARDRVRELETTITSQERTITTLDEQLGEQRAITQSDRGAVDTIADTERDTLNSINRLENNSSEIKNHISNLIAWCNTVGSGNGSTGGVAGDSLEGNY